MGMYVMFPKFLHAAARNARHGGFLYKNLKKYLRLGFIGFFRNFVLGTRYQETS